MNLRYKVKSIPDKIVFNNNYYTLNHSDVKIKFHHTKQANMAYRAGYKNRALNLGKSYFLDNIDFNSGDVILDCGANVGDLYHYFKVNNYNINYIGIEPSPIEYNCLSNNIDDNVSYNVGLWKEKDLLKFYVFSQGADSSLIEPPLYDEIIEVETIRLDELITQKIKLFKLEAEGAEPEVLEGAKDLLHNIEYISADLGFERGKNKSSTFVEVTNYLLQNDFELEQINYKRLTALFKNTK